MHVIPCLEFDGNCRTAFTFYHQCLGGKIAAMMTFNDAPAYGEMFVGENDGDKIMHTYLLFREHALHGSDLPAGLGHQGHKGFSVNLMGDTVEEAERIYSALKENGAEIMPLTETFWAERFGALTDQFGVSWMVNCQGQDANAM